MPTAFAQESDITTRSSLTPQRSGDSLTRVLIWTWMVVVVFGLVQAMANRLYMNPDGISYADLADAYARGDWHNSANACWSPLYPFLLSILFRLFHPSPYFESTAIHLLNFLLYLACFACLQFLIFEIATFQSVQLCGTGRA